MTSSNDVISLSIFHDVIDDVIEVGKISFPKFRKKNHENLTSRKIVRGGGGQNATVGKRKLS